MSWLIDKLRSIAESAAAPDLVAARRADTKPSPGKRQIVELDRPPDISPEAWKRSKAEVLARPLEPPAGVSSEEWLEAARNVELGSAPSEIRAGSDVPSDFSLRIMGLLTP
jgi:hypothetical protein